MILTLLCIDLSVVTLYLLEVFLICPVLLDSPICPIINFVYRAGSNQISVDRDLSSATRLQLAGHSICAINIVFLDKLGMDIVIELKERFTLKISHKFFPPNAIHLSKDFTYLFPLL